MTPIGWIAIYEDGAGGETIFRSTDGGGLSPRDLPATRCLGTRTFYRETVSIDDGPDIHYSDVWHSHDWVVFFEDGPGLWRCRNSETNDGAAREGKEGISVDDVRWERIRLGMLMNDDDNRVGQW